MSVLVRIIGVLVCALLITLAFAAEPDPVRLRQTFLTSPAPPERLEALHAINNADLPDRHQLNTLGLRDAAPEVRAAAAYSLRGEPKVFIPLLIDTLASDPVAAVRYMAALSLASWLTGNGADGCADVTLVLPKLEVLLKALADPAVQRPVAEIFGASYAGATFLPCCMPDAARQAVVRELRHASAIAGYGEAERDLRAAQQNVGRCAPAEPETASFDCATATTRVERLVCGDPALAALDGQVAAAYRENLASTPKPEHRRAEQRAWLRTVRNRCADAACLQRAYTVRLTALRGVCGFLQQYAEYPEAPDVRNRNAERTLGVVCNPRLGPNCLQTPVVTLAELQRLGLAATEPQFQALLEDVWSIRGSLVDIDNDGVDELRLATTSEELRRNAPGPSSIRCVRSYFFKKAPDGTFRALTPPAYAVLHDEARFCHGDLLFVRYEGAVYTVAVYRDIDTAWLGSRTDLREVCLGPGRRTEHPPSNMGTFAPLFAAGAPTPLVPASDEATDIVRLLESRAQIKDPGQYLSLGHGAYLVTVSSAPGISGLYLAVPSTQQVSRVTEGSPEDVTVRELANGTKWLVVKSIGTARRGVGVTTYHAVVFPSGPHGVPLPKVTPLASVEWDTESGTCERAASLGLKVAGDITSVAVRDLNGDGFEDIALRITEQNCGTNTTHTREVVYVYAGGSFRKGTPPSEPGGRGPTQGAPKPKP